MRDLFVFAGKSLGLSPLLRPLNKPNPASYYTHSNIVNASSIPEVYLGLNLVADLPLPVQRHIVPSPMSLYRPTETSLTHSIGWECIIHRSNIEG
jgi:hypothetical protein